MEEIHDELLSIKKRIVQLEENNTTHNNKIYHLEKENDNLKNELKVIDKKMFHYEEQNKKSHMSRVRVQNLQEEMQKLRHEMKEVKGTQSDIAKKYELLEGLKRTLNRVLVPTHKISELEKQMTSIEGITDKIRKMEKRFGNVENDFSTLHSMILQHRHDLFSSFETNISTLRSRLINVEQKFSDGPCNLDTHIFFDTVLNTTQDFNDGRRKLDVCKYNAPAYSPFDRTLCVLDPPEDGHYALITRLGQYGSGEVKAFLGLDGVEKGDYLGLTHGDNDVLSCFKIWKLRRGQKVWVEAERVKGNCKIGFCSFSGWLLTRAF